MSGKDKERGFHMKQNRELKVSEEEMDLRVIMHKSRKVSSQRAERVKRRVNSQVS